MKINPLFCVNNYPKKIVEEVVDDYYCDEFDADGVPKELGVEEKKSCDFFRDYELYSTQKDKLNSDYKKYSYDDVETTVKSRLINRPVNYDSRDYAEGTDLHYCMKSQKSPILKEKFLHLILNDEKFAFARAAIDGDCDFADVIKLVEISTLVDKKNRVVLDKRMLKDGCVLLHKGYSVESVLEKLNLSKFKDSYFGEYYDQRVFKFISQYPEHTDDVLLKYGRDYKSFDYSDVRRIIELKKCCKDKETISEIIKSCRVLNANGAKPTNEHLYSVSQEFLAANDNKWSETCSKILKNLKKYSSNIRAEVVNFEQCEQVKKAVQSGMSFDSILKIFFAVK